MDGPTGNVYWPEDDRYETVPLAELEEYKTVEAAA
jgi:hypothetical protein